MIEARDSTLGIVYAFLGVLAAVTGVVMAILKRSSNAKINGLGRRVNDLAKEASSNTKAVQSLEVFRGQSDMDRGRLWQAMGESKAKMENIERMLQSQSSDIMEAIRASGMQQMEAVHKVELQVVSLAAKSDVAGVLSEQLGKIVAAIMERRDHGDNQ